MSLRWHLHWCCKQFYDIVWCDWKTFGNMHLFIHMCKQTHEDGHIHLETCWCIYTYVIIYIYIYMHRYVVMSAGVSVLKLQKREMPPNWHLAKQHDWTVHEGALARNTSCIMNVCHTLSVHTSTVMESHFNCCSPTTAQRNRWWHDVFIFSHNRVSEQMVIEKHFNWTQLQTRIEWGLSCDSRMHDH